MLNSKKGIESFPFFLFLSLFLAAFVLALSFYQVELFSGFSSQKGLSNSYTRMINTMNTLRSTSDKGSFSSVQLEVPAGYTISISATNNTIIIMNDEAITNTLDFDVLSITDKNGVSLSELDLESGKYQMVLYYGEPISQTEPYEIFFV